MLCVENTKWAKMKKEHIIYQHKRKLFEIIFVAKMIFYTHCACKLLVGCCAIGIVLIQQDQATSFLFFCCLYTRAVHNEKIIQ